MLITASLVSSSFPEEFGWWRSFGNRLKADQVVRDAPLKMLGEFEIEPWDLIPSITEWLWETHKVDTPCKIQTYPKATGYQLPSPPGSFEIHACFSKETAYRFFRKIDELELSPEKLDHAYENYNPLKGGEGKAMFDYLSFLRDCCKAIELEEHRLLVYSEEA